METVRLRLRQDVNAFLPDTQGAGVLDPDHKVTDLPNGGVGAEKVVPAPDADVKPSTQASILCSPSVPATAGGVRLKPAAAAQVEADDHPKQDQPLPEADSEPAAQSSPLTAASKLSVAQPIESDPVDMLTPIEEAIARFIPYEKVPLLTSDQIPQQSTFLAPAEEGGYTFKTLLYRQMAEAVKNPGWLSAFLDQNAIEDLERLQGYSDDELPDVCAYLDRDSDFNRRYRDLTLRNPNDIPLSLVLRAMDLMVQRYPNLSWWRGGDYVDITKIGL